MSLLKVSFQAFLIVAAWIFFIPEAIAVQKTPETDSVQIGLLIPENKSLAASRGAEMAISKANENGGFNSRPFKLVIRSLEGPWGTGSKEAVNLIFKENVCAIMGSHDGRNAHLVEQVITKARIVFLSAWTSDPTLSQAFVPWYFSCVPNDLQQADALIEEIYNKRKIDRIAVVAGNDYDSKLALTSFLKRTKVAGKADPLQFFYDNPGQDFKIILDKINKADIKGIILFSRPPASLKFMQELRLRKMNQSVFGSLLLLDDDQLSEQDLKYYENTLIVSSGNLSGSKSLAFSEEFKRTYGKYPGVVAAYSFDGMSLLIEAIRRAGTDRDEIQKILTKIHFEGVTGTIQFDDKGKRIGVPDLIEIKNGIPVIVER